jgi:hypothetical protein
MPEGPSTQSNWQGNWTDERIRQIFQSPSIFDTAQKPRLHFLISNYTEEEKKRFSLNQDVVYKKVSALFKGHFKQYGVVYDRQIEVFSLYKDMAQYGDFQRTYEQAVAGLEGSQTPDESDIPAYAATSFQALIEQIQPETPYCIAAANKKGLEPGSAVNFKEPIPPLLKAALKAVDQFFMQPSLKKALIDQNALGLIAHRILDEKLAIKLQSISLNALLSFSNGLETFTCLLIYFVEKDQYVLFGSEEGVWKAKFLCHSYEEVIRRVQQTLGKATCYSGPDALLRFKLSWEAEKKQPSQNPS